MAPLMKVLKMTELTPARKMMLNGSFASLRQKTKKKISSLKDEDTFFKGTDWTKVHQDALGVDVFHPDIEKEEVPKAAWLSVLNIERSCYLEQFHHGELGPEGFAALEDFMATMVADAAKIPANKPDGRKWEQISSRPLSKEDREITNAALSAALEAKAFTIGMIWVDLGMQGKRKPLHNKALEYALSRKCVTQHSLESLELTPEELRATNVPQLIADDCFIVVDTALGLQWVEISVTDLTADAVKAMPEIANESLALILESRLAKERANISRAESRGSRSSRLSPVKLRSPIKLHRLVASRNSVAATPTVRLTRAEFEKCAVAELSHHHKIRLSDNTYLKPLDWKESNIRRLKPAEPDYVFTKEEFKAFGLGDLRKDDYIAAAGSFFRPSDRLSNVYDFQMDQLIQKLRKPCGQMSYHERCLAYNVSKAYIVGQIAVRHAMSNFYTSVAKSTEAGADILDTHSRAIDAMKKVEREHRDNIDKMSDLLASVDTFAKDNEMNFRKFKRYKNRYASKLVLLAQKHHIEHLQEEGLLDELDADPLKETIRKKIEDIHLRPIREGLRKSLYAWRKAFFARHTHIDDAHHDRPFTLTSFVGFLRGASSPTMVAVDKPVGGTRFDPASVAATSASSSASGEPAAWAAEAAELDLESAEPSSAGVPGKMLAREAPACSSAVQEEREMTI